jgi:hypothetical protein
MTPKSLSEEMDQDATTPKRRKAMLWQKLGEGKDPEFNNEKGHSIPYVLCDNRAQEPGYAIGTLHSIVIENGSKEYKFNVVTTDGYEPTGGFTHFCIPVQP